MTEQEAWKEVEATWAVLRAAKDHAAKPAAGIREATDASAAVCDARRAFKRADNAWKAVAR